MRKLGHIYCPTGEWSYASTPTIQHLGADYYRVYFASRDRANRGHLFSLDLDMNRPTVPMNIRGPLVGPGRKGTFDDCGISPACFFDGDLYYLGWSLTKTAPFHNAIGVLSVSGGKVEREFDDPAMDRSSVDPISLAYPWVVDENKLFYSSCTWWGDTDKDMEFVLRAGVWDDGWKGCRGDVIPLEANEKAIVRPTVIGRRMWYAIKTDRYRIGYAECEPDMSWQRLDNCSLAPSDGFDSEEVTYPCAFEHEGKTYLLYNGNHYGKTGFGIAVAD